jgi:cytochrome c1
MKFRLSFVAAALAFAGCGFPKAGTVPTPIDNEAVTVAQARWSDSTMASLQRGRELYISNCNGCHSYPDISYYPEAKWPRIMDEKGRKSDLIPADSQLVLRFILAKRNQAPTETAAAK